MICGCLVPTGHMKITAWNSEGLQYIRGGHSTSGGLQYSRGGHSISEGGHNIARGGYSTQEWTYCSRGSKDSGDSVAVFSR
jgi:hypothetical protein